jgi:hypothetical protein
MRYIKQTISLLFICSFATQALAAGSGQPVSGSPSAQPPLSPCEVIRVGSGGFAGLCGGVTPPPPPPGDVNQDLTLVNQTLGKDPVTGGGNNGGNLLGEGGNLPSQNSFSPDQFGALAPAAGGSAQASNSNADDEGILCMNAYLQNGWSDAVMQKKCSGGSDNTSEI